MKLKTPLLTALLAMIPFFGNAFTLDAAGYDGAELPQDPASIQIVGYGEVVFASTEDQPIMVHSGYMHDTLPPNPDLNFDPEKAVTIVLSHRGMLGVDLVFAGIPAGQTIDAPHSVDHDFSVKGTAADVAKPYGIPETASAVLGLLGTALLLLRRMR